MKFNNELELIKVIRNGKTKEEVFESLKGLIKPKSFEGYINKIERLGDDIKFV